MRVRIHLASGAVVDAEEFSTDNGASWSAIETSHAVAAMQRDTGYVVVRDSFTGQWRALRHARIESIGPAPDLAGAIDAETERRIAAAVAGRLPMRVQAEAGPARRHPLRPAPPDDGEPDGGPTSHGNGGQR